MIAAEVNSDAPDFGHLEPMVTAAQGELERAGVTDTPGVVIADAGNWNQEHMGAIVGRGIQMLVRPDAAKAQEPAARLGGRPLRAPACFRRSGAAASTASARP